MSYKKKRSLHHRFLSFMFLRRIFCNIYPFSVKFLSAVTVAGRKLYPYEIKSAHTWTSDFANDLRSFAERDAKIEKGTVIYAGDLKCSG